MDLDVKIKAVMIGAEFLIVSSITLSFLLVLGLETPKLSQKSQIIAENEDPSFIDLQSVLMFLFLSYMNREKGQSWIS